MENTAVGIKVIFAGAAALIANELGILIPVLAILAVAMVVDFLTGMAASVYEGKDNPEAGLSSKVGTMGILKKVGYLAVIAVAMIVDWMIYHIGADLGVSVPGLAGANTFFGLLVAIWFIVNEGISILENVARMTGEKNMPTFLVSILNLLKSNVEKTGGQAANEEKESGGKE
ncbi:holin family protein [Eubacterium limosum]|uniref:phage holin family protein n=1 Tax=Eubacterium limosum TaxID=1736 RepID=UPI0037237CDE